MNYNRIQKLLQEKEYKDLLLGIITFIFFGAMIIQSFYITNAIVPGGSRSGTIGATFYPRLFCGAGCGISLALVLVNLVKVRLKRAGAAGEAEAREKSRWGMVVVSVALMFALVFLIIKLGVIAGGAVYLFVQIMVLTRKEKRTVKYTAMIALLSICVPVLIYIPFRYIFGVTLPMGIFK